MRQDKEDCSLPMVWLVISCWPACPGKGIQQLKNPHICYKAQALWGRGLGMLKQLKNFF